MNTIESYFVLSSCQKNLLQQVIDYFASIGGENKLGRSPLFSYSIDIGKSKPISQRPSSPAMQKHLNKEIDKMLALGIIKGS